jgi:hypothetical protein
MRWVLAVLALAVCFASAQRPVEGTLKVGDEAPGFKLKFLGKKDTFELKSNFGARPTVLIFGSYT